MSDKAWTKRGSAQMVRQRRARRVDWGGCPQGGPINKQRERIYGWEAFYG